MQSSATTVKAYIDELPPARKQAISAMRKVIKKNLPKGFKEGMYYGMIGYVVPLSIYPEGYHCNPDQPLPFINLASQKNYISFYHMGFYNRDLLDWFSKELKALDVPTPSMGKCCVRFKKIESIPYELIGQLCAKITPDEWVSIYKRSLARR